MNLVEALSREIQRIAVLNEQFHSVSRDYNHLAALLEDAHIAMGEGEITGLARVLDKMRAIGSSHPSDYMVAMDDSKNKFVQLIKLTCKTCDKNLIEKPKSILYGSAVIMYCKNKPCDYKRHVFEIEDLIEGENYIRL